LATGNGPRCSSSAAGSEISFDRLALGWSPR
jgi:hypothetical protein